MSTALQATAIENGLIDEQYHDQLLADIAAVVRQAGIPERYVWHSITEYCGADEVDYVSNFKKADCEIGMMYIGKVAGKPVNERMMAIAGACLRNYINAKVMTLYDVLGALKEGDMPSPTVLLIPDFFDGSKVADWQINGLLGMLYKREQQDKKTIIYISDWKAMQKQYGEQFTSHLNGKFIPIRND
jgi:hypothetical protein